MSILEAVILGILQGLTEFLPVSSTAHLTLAGDAMGLVDPARPEAWTAFLAVVQVGTLVAVLAYFRAELAALARGSFAVLARRTPTSEDRAAWRLTLLLAAATMPIVALALLLEDIIEGPLTKDLRVIGVALVAMGLLLAVADRVGRRVRALPQAGWRDAAFMGAFQCLSLVPGASRSGSTITGGLFAGLTRDAAARFSFLLAIPAIAGSALFELPTMLAAPREDLVALAVATVAAAASGYLAIWGMLRWVQTRSLMPFVAYRVALGVVLLWMTL